MHAAGEGPAIRGCRASGRDSSAAGDSRGRFASCTTGGFTCPGFRSGEIGGIGDAGMGAGVPPGAA